jgi:hypothetical protein
MNTSRLVVERLRGMDQRYYTRAEAAALIEEMTWDSYDGWKNAGGFDLVTQDLFDWGSLSSSVETLGGLRITSMHNYSKGPNFNEIIFETNLGTLCRLNLGNMKKDSIPEGDTIFPITSRPFDFLVDEKNMAYTGASIITDSSGELVGGRTRFVPRVNDIGSQSCTFGGRLYMVNGVNAPIVYDGRKVQRAGFNEKPAQPKGQVVQRSYHNQYLLSGGDDSRYFLGTGLKNMGLGSLKPKGVRYTLGGDKKDFVDGKICAYQYKVSFVNERGQESELSEASEMIRFECGDGRKRFVALDLPTGDDTTVARRIYRTRDLLDDFGNALGPERGRSFFFTRELQDNETTRFEDTLSDSNLGALIDEIDFGNMPTGSNLIASFKNCLFLAGGTDNLLKFSATGMPEVFPKLNLIDLGDADAGKITGMYASTNSLVVFKEFGIYLITQRADGGFQYKTISRDLGCVAPKSIRDVPITGLAFLSHKGVFVLKGFLESTDTPTEIQNLSTPIKEVIDRICPSASKGSVACIDRKNKEYWVCVPTIGEQNNLLLVWHYEVGAWSIRKNYPINCAIETKGRSSEIFFGSNDFNMPGIFVFNNYYNEKNALGSTIPVKIRQEDESFPYEKVRNFPVYETAPLKLNGVYSGVHVAYINLYCVAYGNEPIKLNIKLNRNQNVALDSNKGRIQQHTDNQERLPVYGEARFGSHKFGFHRPVVIRFDVSHFHKTLTTEFAVRVLQDTLNKFPNRLMLVGYSIDAKMGEQKNIRNMTDVIAPDRR